MDRGMLFRQIFGEARSLTPKNNLYQYSCTYIAEHLACLTTLVG